MLELVAMAEEDGWAFVRTGEELVVVQPPYQVWNWAKATESQLEQAICRHGFRQAGESFPDWRQLIQHLKQRQVAAWQERGGTGLTEREMEEMVQELSSDRLAEFLDHVETELLPRQQWAAAEKLLRVLLGVRTVLDSDFLRHRTLSLWDRCQEKRKSVMNVSAGEVAWRFPHTPRSYQELGNARAQAGSPFC